MVSTRSSSSHIQSGKLTRKQANDAAKADNMPDMRVLIVHTGDAAVRPSAPTEAISFTLPHPRTGGAAAMMLAAGRLLEVNVQRPAQSAWFAGNCVIADGGLHMATPVDPVFFLLPLLEAAAQQNLFREVSEILDEAPQPGWRHLSAVAAPAAACVCNTRETGGQTFVRLNDAKVLAWMRCKAEAAAAALEAACPGTYAGVDAASMRQYAVALLGEWLQPKWHLALQAALGLVQLDASGQPIEASQPVQQQQPSPEDARPQKRLRVDPKEVAKRRAAEAKAEAKAAQLAKETRGMKKMSSFFAKAQPKAAKAAA